MSSGNIQTHIEAIVSKVFPNLNTYELNKVQEYTLRLLFYMMKKYGFNEENVGQFEILLTQNNNQHIYSAIKLLLPYIDDTNDFALFASIKKLSDISVKKDPTINTRTHPDKNPYAISTYQYSRYYDLEKEQIHANTHAEYKYNSPDNAHPNFYEYLYSLQDMEDNFHLLCETIELTRTKMMVNWLDIMPITKDDYKSSRLYQRSPTYIDNKMMVNDNRMSEWSLDEENPMFNYNGISCYDMFNAIHVYLFKEIYNSGVKWLMYEKQVVKNTVPCTYLQILDRVVSIEYLTQGYGTLSTTIQKNIRDQWSQLKSQSNNTQKNFLKCVIFKFDRNYCSSDMETEFNYDSKAFYKPYEKVNFDDEDLFLNLEDININSTEFNLKLQDFFSKIPYEIIHDFFHSQIERFNRTWYGKQIIKNGRIDTVIKLNDDMETSYSGRNNTYYLTYKNIYNYAKYVSIQVLGNNSKISNARSLSKDQWTKFFAVMNGEGQRFKLPNVIIKTYGDDSRADIPGFEDFIDRNFKNTFIDNVFLVFISVGLLTELSPDPNMTNKELLGHDDDSRKKALKDRFKSKYISNKVNNKRYLNTEYYLTREPYKNLELYKGRDNKDDDTKIDWFTHLHMGAPWYNFFALSLISQINFYHHFINNRVMMVTGSTGQGKSVVVPILFYYANVALTLNSMTKVLSTQVLVAATTSNSIFMATNLGVPIMVNDFETNSPYIQYSTQKDKHDVKNSETFIKEVTDRTLLEQLLTNPLLKKPRKIKDGVVTEYRDENMYDIIIIDEAHMHNVSMDMILSIIKNAILINNQLKLVITSATMDADEFIYRRFYKYIDDNFIYPMTNLVDPETNIPINKSVVDRRFHISPPGETNRFTVTDIYTDNDVNTYEESERLGILKVKQIMSNVPGDILFFTDTTANVLRLTAEINSFTPSNVIALPLYSKIKDTEQDVKWFDLIKGIDKSIHSLQLRKEDVVDVIGTGASEYIRVKAGTYNRAIIIATNVVEASVTIDSLKAVIDTGYAFNVAYDAETGLSTMGTEPIADASRLQRRGRVGRTSAGTVYYMYKLGARAHIKPEYDLVTKDITFDVFKIMSSHATNLLADLKFHPQNFKFTKTNYNEYANFLSNEPNNIVKKIYQNQYQIMLQEVESEHPLMSTFGSMARDHEQVFGRMYEDGFGVTDMIDKNGKFFIIHPAEKQLIRNVINGDIVRTVDNTDNYLIKISRSLLKAQALKYLFYEDTFAVNEANYDSDKLVYKPKYVTDIGAVIQKESESLESLTANFSEDAIIRLLKTIYVANKFNCVDDVLKILAFTYSCISYKTMIRTRDDNPLRHMISEFVQMWQHPVSELMSYLNIMNRFISEEIENDTIVIRDTRINDRYRKFEDFYRENNNKLFANTKLIDASEFSREEVKYFIESKNRRYRDEERIDKYKTMIKNVRSENGENAVTARLCFVNIIAINKAVRLYEKLQKLVRKKTMIDSMTSFKDYYIISTPLPENAIIVSFLDNYVINISKYNGTIKNVISGIENPLPKITLLLGIYDHCFYIHGTDEIMGLTVVTPDQLSKYFNIASFELNTNEARSLRSFVRPEYIASQANVVNDINKSYDMNDIIVTELKKL